MIPLSVPNLNGKEAEYVEDCIRSGWVSTAGKYVSLFEDSFADFVKKKDAVSTVNGTSALHISLEMIGVGLNDLVLMPNITFVASANAISYTGAEPILIDIDKDTWQMDLKLLREFLSKECSRTKNNNLIHKKTKKRIAAIMIVHVQGGMVNMEEILKISLEYNLPLVEDAAEALGSKFDGKSAGSFGVFGCYSFNGNKIMTTGGGGMIVSNNEELLDKARHIVTTAKTDPLRYFHDEVGYNYRLVNVLAAIGLAQLEQLQDFINKKDMIASFYMKNLKNVGDITFQKYEDKVTPNHWLFTIKTSHMEDLLKFLNDKNIISRPFWMPMSELPMYSKCTYYNFDDICSDIHKDSLSIPCSTNISQEELEEVCCSIKDFFDNT
mgnify:CR=1 FL=1|tara:strand:- start:1913 stop:3055 length:1143 start_codon:yes stop_codon:yes gene_type:complete